MTEQILQPFTKTAGKPMVTVLLDFGFHYADFVLRPDLLSLTRLVIGEAERFPEIRRNHHRSSPQQALSGIIAYRKLSPPRASWRSRILSLRPMTCGH